MTHDEMIAVLQAQKEGKSLQYHVRNVAGCSWGDVARGAILDFVNKVYRINPSQPKKLRPWLLNEVPMLALVTDDGGLTIDVIVGKRYDHPEEQVVQILLASRSSYIDTDDFADDFELTNNNCEIIGSCGVWE